METSKKAYEFPEHKVEVQNSEESEINQSKREITKPKKNFLFLFSNKKCGILTLILTSLLVLCVIVAIVLIIKKNSKVNKYQPVILPSGEPIVADIKRKVNEISKYREIKTTKMNLKAGNTPSENEENITTEFVFNVYNSTVLEDKTNLTSGYIIITNMTKDTKNGTQFLGGVDVFNLTDDTNDTLRMIEENETEAKDDEYVIPMIKFSFYQNGTTKDIYHPENIDDFMYSVLKDLVEKLVPILSEKLYSNTNSNKARLLEESTSNDTVRQVGVDNSNIILIEETNTQASSDQIIIVNSTINSKTNTTIDNEEGKITNIQSASNTSFSTKDDNQLNDIEMNEDNAINKDDMTNNNENVINSGIESLTSNITSNISLLEKIINQTLTDKINSFTKEIHFISFKKSIQGNSTLRILNSLNLTSTQIFTRDISSIPTYGNTLKGRNLKISSFLQPVELVYPIFKFNLLGVQTSLTVLIDAGIKTGKATFDVLFSMGSLNMNLISLGVESNLPKALANVIEVSESMIELITELNQQIKNHSDEWQASVFKIITTLVDGLINTYDLGDSYKIPFFEILKNVREICNEVYANVTNAIYKSDEF